MLRVEPELKFAVGLSGGVDSATAAALLKKQGHEVIGVHMLRSDVGLPGCTAERDMSDARAVARHLDVPFALWDFRDEYQKRVIDRFVTEYQAGRTPNPDIWCNEEMKFGLFMEKAIKDLGVDYVATGHYARIQKSEIRNSKSETNSNVQDPNFSNVSNFDIRASNFRQSNYKLLQGIDGSKDQSYFLYRLNQYQLSKAVFPLGEKFKGEVRAIANKLSLPVAEKPDSAGICFIGEIDLKEFLKQKIDFKPGGVVNTRGEVIGKHDGVQFYTIGQRHGFEITKYQGKPVYVVDKDVENNRLVVGRDEESDVESFVVTDLHWVGGSESSIPLFANASAQSRLWRAGFRTPAAPSRSIAHGTFPTPPELRTRIRHLGKLIPCDLVISEDLKIGTCDLKIPVRGVAPGQHAVLYFGDEVLGGGVILHK